MAAAVVLKEIGPPSVLAVETRDPTVRKLSEVLVKNVSTSVNPVDLKTRKGSKETTVPRILGGDVAGTVAEPDEDGKFKVGDRVIALTNGFRWDNEDVFSQGTYQQYVSVPAGWLARVPANIPLETAGGISLVALTAWQALESASLSPGQRVLVVAGAGGVGHFAIQLAKVHWGAYVVATAGPKNQEFLKELGADEAVDYNKEGYLDKYIEQPFDAIVDVIGGDTEEYAYKVLAKGGTFAHIHNTGTSQARIGSGKQWTDKKYTLTLVQPNGEQLQQIVDYISEGKIKLVVDKSFPISEVAAAHELVETGHVRGKVVLTF
eukprot:jgi/Botrbrau1/18373/Bobra.0179s0091.1